MEKSMEQQHAEPNYMAIFWWLFALTIIEVSIVYAHLPHPYTVVALVLTALMKAFLVAWNFMHLRFEKPVLIAVVALPLFLLVDLFLGLMPDIAHRIF
jgi:cytochrome c oxidase subunit IV